MSAVKWGVISTADIGMKKVLPGMLKSKDIEIVAIASRKLKTAQAAAAELGIAKAYGSYEEMLADPEIEAVYNPLPNHLHVPLTLLAAKYGKHVLCEKPIAITAKEAKKLKKAPKKVMIAEAFMVRHALQWIDVKKRVDAGEIGSVRAIQVLFSYFNADPKNVRNMAGIGGGGLLDIGCYPITVSRFIFDGEPVRVTGTIERDPKFKTDRLMGGLADFGKGRHLSFTISTQAAPYQRVNILGTKGRIEVEIPFNAPPDKPNRVFVQGMEMNEGTWHSYPVSDQYMLQAEAFGRAIRAKKKPAWGVDDAIKNMKIIDAFFKSEKTRKWEKV
ncbi:Gfo/Idh/MocA family protein [Aestuariivirga litoralis]|uniref:Gfo/Idh/MocA family protein n=1 Tax=Aestuariivirga litoralis TaxID=2650924 RepID=UPI0018C54F7F|nr:Gfo/Idh/MocA family oxidoreductase [Aestuariivirga litoralis]MBG1232877.1 Gfo/Idh/MocA family oxidoreductase [Aestuariivirga litoralis]